MRKHGYVLRWQSNRKNIDLEWKGLIAKTGSVRENIHHSFRHILLNTWTLIRMRTYTTLDTKERENTKTLFGGVGVGGSVQLEQYRVQNKPNRKISIYKIGKTLPTSLKSGVEPESQLHQHIRTVSHSSSSPSEILPSSLLLILFFIKLRTLWPRDTFANCNNKINL